MWKPMHLQPVFADVPYYETTVAEKLFDDGLCLPSGSNLSDDDRLRIKKVIAFFSLRNNSNEYNKLEKYKFTLR